MRPVARFGLLTMNKPRFWWELRPRPMFDRCVVLMWLNLIKRLWIKPKVQIFIKC